MTRGLAAAVLLLTATGCADGPPAGLDAASAVRDTTTAPAATAPATTPGDGASPSPTTTGPRAARTADLPAARSTTARAATSKKPRRTGTTTRSTGAGRTSTRPPAPDSGSPQLTRLEQRALTLINGHRRNHGCAPLTVDARLLAASREYATKMVRTQHFSHQSVDGDGPSERAKSAGFPGGAAENIMMGFSGDADGLVDDPTYGWMQSPGHRDNILTCGSTVAGIGYDPGVIDPKYAAGSWVLMLSRL